MNTVSNFRSLACNWFGSNARNPCLLVRDDERMKMCGKALGVRNVGGSQILGIFQIQEFSENSKTFKNQKAFECYQNGEKAPKNSREFLHICQKHPKKVPKISFCFCQKHSKNLLNSEEVSIWRHLCWVYHCEWSPLESRSAKNPRPAALSGFGLGTSLGTPFSF